MTLDEKIGQMGIGAYAIPHLGVDEVQYWSEALHGLVDYDPSITGPGFLWCRTFWDSLFRVRLFSAKSVPVI
jgi:hypothetical protein